MEDLRQPTGRLSRYRDYYVNTIPPIIKSRSILMVSILCYTFEDFVYQTTILLQALSYALKQPRYISRLPFLNAVHEAML